ncbi:zinc finger protein 420 [Danaus plexippus plexippus]|uniref:Zinc finger protein 420 n=1 Tax=Danaus plexippus plexippus TaxID=278856 RepID=A0A212FBX5_DANPL|nr:zinc finger protein 420 [Danaus plexippus plexippus]
MEMLGETENVTGSDDQKTVENADIKHCLDEKTELRLINEELTECKMEMDEQKLDVSGGEVSTFRKYSLREVKPVIKPFQHYIKMRMRNHQIKSEFEEQYMCEVCYKISTSLSSYRTHMKQHSVIKEYLCSQCDDVFKTNRQLCDHKVQSHKDGCFSCQECQLAFSDHYTYLLHTFQHIRPPYICPECRAPLSKYKSLAAHLKIHFNDLVECHICHKEVRQMRLTEHIRDHKGGVVCVECGKVCNNKKNYDYHLISHTGVKPYQCLYCGKGFSTANQMKTHTAVHTNIRRYKCDICHQEFKQHTDLTRHKQGHDGLRFICDYCRKKFKQKLYLAYHIRNHTNYRPYKCPNCQSSFTTLASLRSHIQYTHVSKRKFFCLVCDYGFRVHCQYLRHLRSKRHLQNAFSSEENNQTN